MNDLKLLEIRRGYIRKAGLCFGVPVCVVFTPIYFYSVSGPFYPIAIFYVFSIILCIQVSYLWSLVMWRYAKDGLIKMTEQIEAATAKRQAVASTTPNPP